MNKGVFSGVRRNTRSAVEQGLNDNDVVPAEDDPLSSRKILNGFKPPHLRFRKTTQYGLQRRYPIDNLLSPPIATYPISASGPASARILRFGNGIWVGVLSATIHTSTDAVTWVTQASNFGTTVINSVAYGNGLWVAGGNTGQLRTSTDGITWVTQTSNFGTTHIQSVAYGNGLWVAGGAASQIRSSTDGVTWVTQTSSHLATVTSLLFGDGIWLAGGISNLSTEDRLATSTDLVTWVSRTVKSSTLNRVNLLRSRQGYYMQIDADSNSRLSSDGITWTTVGNGGSFTSPIQAATLNGLTIVPQFTSGSIYYSNDGTTYNQVFYGNTSWSGAGSDGKDIIVVNNSGQVMKFTPTVVRGTSSLPSLYNEWYIQ